MTSVVPDALVHQTPRRVSRVVWAGGRGQCAQPDHREVQRVVADDLSITAVCVWTLLPEGPQWLPAPVR